MHCKSLWIKASAKCINVNDTHLTDIVFTKLCGTTNKQKRPSWLIMMIWHDKAKLVQIATPQNIMFLFINNIIIYFNKKYL